MDNKIVILVGDVGEYLAEQAKQLDPLAELVTDANSADLTSGVYYTSLGDFAKLQDFVKVLSCADTLIYSPPTEWSDMLAEFSYMQCWTEFYLRYFRDRKEVLELPRTDLGEFLALADHRRNEGPQLWSVGCSITHGVGIDPEQRYGQLVANQLNLPVSFLSDQGSSIEWATDQILRSDIRAGDIIVWGITTHNRFAYYDKEVIHVNTSYYQQHPKFNQTISIDRLDQPDMMYRAVTRIAEVVNVCRKLNVTLIIAGVLVDRNFIKYASEFPNYLQLFGGFGHEESELFIDLGTDQSHPGPLTHQWYADELIKYIHNLNISI